MALNASTILLYHAEAVTGVLIDENFLRHTSEMVGGTLDKAKLDGSTDGAFTLTVVRTMPTVRLPDFARKFVGETLTVTQTEKWSLPSSDGSRTAEIHVAVSGLPVEATALQKLIPTDGGTRVEIDGTVSSSIPFLGRKIADAAEPMMAKALNMQATQAKSWLDGQK